MSKHRDLTIDDKTFKLLYNALDTYRYEDTIAQKDRLAAIELLRQLCQGVNDE